MTDVHGRVVANSVMNQGVQYIMGSMPFVSCARADE
jgi:hypothetical protein